MAHLKVEVDGNVIFNEEVEGFHVPPTMPTNPNRGPGFAALPPPPETALAKATDKLLKNIGFKRVRIEP